MKGQDIKIVSYNCQGLNMKEKRRDVLDYLKSKKFNIYCLQDTHFSEEDEVFVKNLWGGECYFSSFSSNQRGVAILLSANFDFKVHKSKRDKGGNLLGLEIEIEGKKFTLINLYGPNVDTPHFYDSVSDVIDNFNNHFHILCGDFNLVQNFDLDTSNYININNPRAREKVISMKEIYNLIDPFRDLNPDLKRFTWRKKTPLKQSRLDFFLISDSLFSSVQDVQIENSYRSDHSPVVLSLKINDFVKGRGLWKFNNSLLHDPEYVKLIKDKLLDVKDQYSVFVYNRDSLKDIDDLDIEFIIDDQLFLDVLLTEFRGKTISYSTFKKRERTNLENKLTLEIKRLEENVQSDQILNEIDNKKTELKILRQNKVQGEYIRSRTQWIEEGEKPTNFFCNLENRNFVNKTIPKLIAGDGTIIESQKEILNEAKCFYEKLYKKKDCIRNVNLSRELPFQGIPKLTEDQKKSLEGDISLTELTAALKKMKNNKSPGSDGFTTEFFKFFWSDIGKFVLRAINKGYQNGKMSITQRQGVIVCIPKEDKPKQYMKNWRPITLLNTVYKLASSCIAERLKSVLSYLIDSDQTGFIPGRFIGENCRLIYDIMHFTEENDIPGILLLIDFEKAFDSISWSFLYEVLRYFNFGNSIIDWVKTFYNNITSTITQNGFLSDFFQVERGCRQGDPLSPYIFLLCAEILGILIRNNEEVKGIVIDDTEYVLSQYADDTSLILDGSPVSLDASLRLLQFYADISGLNINIDKTKVIWIGSKKFSEEKICVKRGLKWGSSSFKLLGINFSVDLEQMLELNYKPKFQEIDSIIKQWSKQYLTPLGKITLIKTLMISKLNHLFLSIPSPNENMLNQFISNIYNFLWDGKPDKVKRDLLCQEYYLGGLKMVNVRAFIQGLKLTWIRRILHSDSKWLHLLKANLGLDFKELLYLGPIKVINNKFWLEVFEAWKELNLKRKVTSVIDVLGSSLWKNNNIQVDNSTVYYKDWIEKGIWTVNDLLTPEGEFMSFQYFRESFSINCTFLHFYGLVLSVKKWLKSVDANYINGQLNPLIPFNISIFMRSPKGGKDMYNVLNKNICTVTSEKKWEDVLDLREIPWHKVNSYCLLFSQSTKFRWFQYRIIHRILGTNSFLAKIKLRDSNLCTFCKEVPETVEHLFWGCHIVSELWQELSNWIFEKTNIELPLNLILVLFGIMSNRGVNFVKNKIILLTKFYIFRVKVNEGILNFTALKNYIKENLNLEKHISSKKITLIKYTEYWSPWEFIFDIQI